MPITPESANPQRLRQLRDVDPDSFAHGDVPVWDEDLELFVGGPGGGPGGPGGPEADPVATAALAAHAALQPAHGADVAGAPRPPTAHGHAMAEITGLAAALAALATDTDLATAVDTLTDLLEQLQAEGATDDELADAIAAALVDINAAIEASSTASAAALAGVAASLTDAIAAKASQAALDIEEAARAAHEAETTTAHGGIAAAVDLADEVAARTAADEDLQDRAAALEAMELSITYVMPGPPAAPGAFVGQLALGKNVAGLTAQIMRWDGADWQPELGGDKRRVQLVRNANQVIPHNVHTAITFDTVVADTENGLQADDLTYVVAITGWWTMQAWVYYPFNATGSRQTTIWKNGGVFTPYSDGRHAAGTNPISTQVRLVGKEYLTVGDALLLTARHMAGAGVNLNCLGGLDLFYEGP